MNNKRLIGAIGTFLSMPIMIGLVIWTFNSSKNLENPIGITSSIIFFVSIGIVITYVWAALCLEIWDIRDH